MSAVAGRPHIEHPLTVRHSQATCLTVIWHMPELVRTKKKTLTGFKNWIRVEWADPKLEHVVGQFELNHATLIELCQPARSTIEPLGTFKRKKKKKRRNY